MISTSYTDNNFKLLELLRKMDRFKPFSDKDLRSLMELGKFQEYKRGDLVVKEGEYDCWLYFLISGSFEVLKGEKVINALDKKGDIFGEMSIIDGSPRSASIRAASNAVVLGVDSALLDKKESNNDISFCYTIYRVFAEVLAKRLRVTTYENLLLQKKLS